MPFKKILVALDGSENSQIASDYAFALARNLDAKLVGQHVVDPRIVDLFLEPGFANELGFAQTTEASGKVFSALRKIGKVILNLFEDEAKNHELKVKVSLDEGNIVAEILRYSRDFDLLVMGHRGKHQNLLPGQIVLGSVAERVILGTDVPVLITVQPLSQIKQILVAYDGSESARGALLMAEQLAKKTDRKFKAILVAPSTDTQSTMNALADDGRSYLREKWKEEVFVIKHGPAAGTITEYAQSMHSLLVIGSYGFRDPEDNVLGTTTTKIIRETQTSVLIYKHTAKRNRKKDNELATSTF